jgi:hypothetical protein
MSAIRRTLAGTGSVTLTVGGALLVGFAVPAAWIFVASRIEGGPVSGPMVAFVGTGILVTCWLLLAAATVARRRLGAAEDHPKVRRASWNVSVHEGSRSEPLDPMERMFVTAAIIAMLAYGVWFLFFAGQRDPLPGSGFG